MKKVMKFKLLKQNRKNKLKSFKFPLKKTKNRKNNKILSKTLNIVKKKIKKLKKIKNNKLKMK